MRIYEYKLDGSKRQYAAIDEAIRVGEGGMLSEAFPLFKNFQRQETPA